MGDPVLPPARVAFIGLGVMGRSMASNLLRAGFALTIASRTRHAAADTLVARGARWADSAADAAHDAAAICLCVPDTGDVEAVLFGPGGLAATAAPGSLVIDFSTISATATAGFATRLTDGGITLLDSPVSGGPKGAEDATLTCMVGGDADAFARAGAILGAVGRTITHLGPAGAGQVCKSANQLLIACTMQAVGEALSLGIKAGLDPEAMRTALLGGSARSAVLEIHAKRMIEDVFAAGFRAELMLKDIRLAQQATRDHGVYAPATAQALQSLQAAVNAGDGGRDATVVGRLIARLSDLPGLKRR